MAGKKDRLLPITIFEQSRMNTLALISPTAEFVQLPWDVRAEVERWIKALERIVDAKPKGPAIAAVAQELRVGESTVRFKLKKWLDGDRHFSAIVNRAKVPHWEERLPDEFIQEVKARFEGNKRKCRPAWRQLIRDCQNGIPIPGYDRNPPIDPILGHPEGWSYQNLMKLAKSTKFEMTAMRIGLGKALSAHGPKIFTSRVGLWPMSHVMFDDITHDNFVHWRVGKSIQLCRVQELGVLDVLSGSRFAWGARPQAKRDDDTKDSLKGADARLLFASVLHGYGYSPLGTEWVIEHGTSTLPDRLIDIVTKATEGKVTFRFSGFLGKEQAIAGMFRGTGGGNPRHKPHLESLHNLIHNELAALPAQTGPDKERRPEELAGLLAHTSDLIKVCEMLTEYQRDLLRLPTMEYYSEYLPLLRTVYDRIDERTWHSLEGWRECGFMSTQYRVSLTHDQWMTREEYLALPAPAQVAVREVVNANPTEYQRPCSFSPRQVFRQGLRTLVPAPVSLIAEIVYQDLARPEKVKDNSFLIRDDAISPDEVRYESRIVTLDKREIELRDRETYDAVVNPFDPSVLWVYTAKGAFLGLAPLDSKAGRGDYDAVNAKLGRREKRLASLIEPLKKRHASLARQASARDEHNANVIEGPASEEERRLAEYTASNSSHGDHPDFSALLPE